MARTPTIPKRSVTVWLSGRTVDNPLFRLRQKWGFSAGDLAAASNGAFLREQVSGWSLATAESRYAFPREEAAKEIAAALRRVIRRFGGDPAVEDIPTAKTWDALRRARDAHREAAKQANGEAA